MKKASEINNRKEVNIRKFKQGSTTYTVRLYGVYYPTSKINTTNLWRLSFRNKVLISINDFLVNFFPKTVPTDTGRSVPARVWHIILIPNNSKYYINIPTSL